MSESGNNSQTELNNSQMDNTDPETSPKDNPDPETSPKDNPDPETSPKDNPDPETSPKDSPDLETSEMDNPDLDDSPNDDDLNPSQDDDVDLQNEKFRRLFIGGLDPETSEETLKQHFEQWGEIVDCVVVRRPGTKQSRGFGFVSFKTAEMLDDAQKNRPHKIDEKEVDTKRVTPRDQAYDNHSSANKMYVGGLSDETEDDIRGVFSRFGKIEKIEMALDRNTGKQKHYCFITFDDFDSVDQCLLRERIFLKGRYVKVNKAVDRGRNGGMINERRGRGGFRGMRSRGGNYGNYDNDYGYEGRMNYSYNMRGGRRFRGHGGRNWGGYNGVANYGNFGNDFNDGYTEFGSGYGSRYGGGPTFGTGAARRNAGPYGRGFGNGRRGNYRR